MQKQFLCIYTRRISRSWRGACDIEQRSIHSVCEQRVAATMPELERRRVYPKFAGIFVLALATIGLMVTFTFIARIPQWSSYHQFADTRKIGGIPNFFNVISNVLFILVAMLGFHSLKKQWQNKKLSGKESVVFLVLLIGVFLTGVGSAYYHLLPDNNRLVWDRLPMTIVFMSLLSLTIMEKINFKLGFWLLIPLVGLGIFSVLYWYFTELSGYGDLRLYGLVQFYSIFLILIIVLLFPKSYPPLTTYIWMLCFYGIAKMFEDLDMAIFKLGHIISGHTLKHIFSAVAIYAVVIILNKKPRILGNEMKTARS